MSRHDPAFPVYANNKLTGDSVFYEGMSKFEFATLMFVIQGEPIVRAKQRAHKFFDDYAFFEIEKSNE